MKVALVNAPAAQRYIIGRDEPIHLEYLAAQVRNDNDVLILDALNLNLTAETVVEQVCSWGPNLLGVSLGFTASYRTSLEICSGVKKAIPEVLTVLGGNTATFLAADLAKREEVDVIVRGEGDLTFRELVTAVENGGPFDEITGLTFRRSGRLVDTGHRAPVGDVDSLPFPARDILPSRQHYRKVVLAARGCPYGCIYCSTSAFWERRFRPRKVECILDEVRLLQEDPCLEYFAFADDCFTLVPDRVFQVCSGIEALSRKIRWSCTGRIENMSPGLVERMARSGCRNIFFGVESGSKRILESIGRRYTPEDVEEVYRICVSNNIKPSFSYVLGLPSETKEDLNATFSLIQKLDGIENGVHILTPFPGTPLAQQPDLYGIEILPHTVEDLDINSRSVINTEHFTSEQTEASFRAGLGYCYRAMRRNRTWNKVMAGRAT